MKSLIIIDVQKEFEKFIQKNLVEELYNYSKNFDKVYQIWDANENDVSPTYTFPNEVRSIKKLFGKNHFSQKVKEYIENLEEEPEEGTVYELSEGNGFLVRVDNNHGWFYINPELYNLIQEVKNDDVVLVGGAENECLKDVEVAFDALGVDTQTNKKYVYSAKTNSNDVVKENLSKKQPTKPIKTIENMSNILSLEGFRKLKKL